MLGHNDQQVNRFGMNPLSDPSCVMKEASSSVAVTSLPASWQVPNTWTTIQQHFQMKALHLQESTKTKEK